MKIYLYIALLSTLLLQACGGGDSSSQSAPSGATVSGQMLVPGNTAADSDVNNRDAPFRNNNSFSSPQTVPNPVLLGGYVNIAGAGPDGRSLLAGDPVDSYAVDLSAGQEIVLFISETDINNNDLELVLLRSSGEVIDASTGRSHEEVLYVPHDGSYVVQVQAFTGASGYSLSIGYPQGARSAGHGMALSADFVPGEVTVQFKEQQYQSLQSLGLKALADNPQRRGLFQLDELNSQSQKYIQNIPGTDPLVFADDKLRQKYQTLMAVKQLQQRDDVASASPNFILSAQAVPDDPLYRYQWHYPMISMPQAWDLTQGSAEVIVAVIDTGVLLGHPDLQGKLVDGYDFIRNRNVALDGDGIDNNPDDPGDSPDGGTGSSFHGTHVAGTVGALSNNGSGTAGIGWNTMIMPLRVLGKGGNGTDYDIEQAIRFAAGLANDSGTRPARRADIINLSLGGPAIASSFQNVITAARNAGVMIVAAAGNNGDSTVTYPGALDGVISVAAVDIVRQRANYSNYNYSVDIAAPGGNNQDVNGDGVIDGVVSTLGDDSQAGSIRAIFAPLFGTSMATPHVAGILSLMKAIYPGLSPSEVDSLIRNGDISSDIGQNGRDDEFGYGLIDAYDAVQAANALVGGRAPEASPELSIAPRSLNFSSSHTALSINLGNSGGGSLQLLGATENSNGRLSITANAVDSNGLGTYTVMLNRSNQATGTYRATLRFVSNANTVEVAVVWQVLQSGSSGDAGYQYTLLVDPDTLESLYEVRNTPVNGLYTYRFVDIPDGDYLLVSGSDNDNDTYICEEGESCGAFPVLSRAQRLTIAGQRQNLNFDINFNTRFVAPTSQLAGQPGEQHSGQAGFQRKVHKQLH